MGAITARSLAQRHQYPQREQAREHFQGTVVCTLGRSAGARTWAIATGIEELE